MAKTDQLKQSTIETTQQWVELKNLKDWVVNQNIKKLNDEVETNQNLNFSMRKLDSMQEYNDVIMADTTDAVHVVLAWWDWCPPCKTFKENTSQSIAQKYNESPKIIIHYYDSRKNSLLNKNIAKEVGWLYWSWYPSFAFIQKWKILDAAFGTYGSNEFIQKVKDLTTFSQAETAEEVWWIKEMTTAQQYDKMFAAKDDAPQILLKYTAANKQTIEKTAKGIQENAKNEWLSVDIWLLPSAQLTDGSDVTTLLEDDIAVYYKEEITIGAEDSQKLLEAWLDQQPITEVEWEEEFLDPIIPDPNILDTIPRIETDSTATFDIKTEREAQEAEKQRIKEAEAEKKELENNQKAKEEKELEAFGDHVKIEKMEWELKLPQGKTVICIPKKDLNKIKNQLVSYDGSRWEILIYTFDDADKFYGSQLSSESDKHTKLLIVSPDWASYAIEITPNGISWWEVLIDTYTALTIPESDDNQPINDINIENLPEDIPQEIEKTETLAWTDQSQKFWNKQILDSSVFKYLGSDVWFDDPTYDPKAELRTSPNENIKLAKNFALKENAWEAVSKLAAEVSAATWDSTIQLSLWYIQYKKGSYSYDHQSWLSVDIKNFNKEYMSGWKNENSTYIAQYKKRVELAAGKWFVASIAGDTRHWRYVGVKFATFLKKENISFKEYYDRVQEQAKQNGSMSANGKVSIYKDMLDADLTTLKASQKNMSGRKLVLLDKTDTDTLDKLLKYSGEEKIVVVLVDLAAGETSTIIDGTGATKPLADEIDEIDIITMSNDLQIISWKTVDEINEYVENNSANEYILVCGSHSESLLKKLFGWNENTTKTTIFVSALEEVGKPLGLQSNELLMFNKDDKLEGRDFPYSEYDALKLLNGTKKENITVYDQSLPHAIIQLGELFKEIDSKKVIVIPYDQKENIDTILSKQEHAWELHIVIRKKEDTATSILVYENGEAKTIATIDEITLAPASPASWEIVKDLSKSEIDAMIEANATKKQRILLMPSNLNKDDRAKNLAETYTSTIPLVIVVTDDYNDILANGASFGFLDQNDTILPLDGADPLSFFKIFTTWKDIAIPIETNTNDPDDAKPDESAPTANPNGAPAPTFASLERMDGPWLKKTVETKGTTDKYTASYGPLWRKIYISNHAGNKVSIQRHQDKYKDVRETDGASHTESFWYNGIKTKMTILNNAWTIEVSLDFTPEDGSSRPHEVIQSWSFAEVTKLDEILYAGGRPITGYSKHVHAADGSSVSPDDAQMLTGLDDKYQWLQMQYSEEYNMFVLWADRRLARGQKVKDKVYIWLKPDSMPYGQRVSFTDAVHGKPVRAMLQIDKQWTLWVRIDTSSTEFLQAVEDDAKTWAKRAKDILAGIPVPTIPDFGGWWGEDAPDPIDEWWTDTVPDVEPVDDGRVALADSLSYKWTPVLWYNKIVVGRSMTTLQPIEDSDPLKFEIKWDLTGNFTLASFTLDQFDDTDTLVVPYALPIVGGVKSWYGYKYKLKLDVDDDWYMSVTMDTILPVDELKDEEVVIEKQLWDQKITAVATRVECKEPWFEQKYFVTIASVWEIMIFGPNPENDGNIWFSFDIKDLWDDNKKTYRTKKITLSDQDIYISVSSIEDGKLILSVSHTEEEKDPNVYDTPYENNESDENAEVFSDKGWINPWFDKSGIKKALKDNDKRIKFFNKQALRAMPAEARKEVIDFVTSKSYLKASPANRMVMAAEFVAKMNHTYDLRLANSDKDVVCRDSLVLIAEMWWGYDVYKEVWGYANGKENGKRTSKILKLKNDPISWNLSVWDRVHINDKWSKTDRWSRKNPEWDSHSCVITNIEEITDSTLKIKGKSTWYTMDKNATTYLVDEISWKYNYKDKKRPKNKKWIYERKIILSDDPKLVDYENKGKAAVVVYKWVEYTVRSLKYIERPQWRGALPKREDVSKVSSAPDGIPETPNKQFRESYDWNTEASIRAWQTKLRSMWYATVWNVDGKAWESLLHALDFLEENDYKPTGQVTKEFLSSIGSTNYSSLFKTYFDVPAGKKLNAYGVKSVLEQIHKFAVDAKMSQKDMKKFLGLMVAENKTFKIHTDGPGQEPTPIGQVFPKAWEDARKTVKNIRGIDMPAWTPTHTTGENTWYNQCMASAWYMQMCGVFENPREGYVKYLLWPEVKTARINNEEKNTKYRADLTAQAKNMKLYILEANGWDVDKESFNTSLTPAQKTKMDDEINKLTPEDLDKISEWVQKYYEQFMY